MAQRTAPGAAAGQALKMVRTARDPSLDRQPLQRETGPSAVEAETLWGKMSELFAHWPADYHEPEHPPEDQSWGWLILLAVAALATLAGVVIGWPAAIAVIAVAAALVLLRSFVRRRHRRASSPQAVGNPGDE